MPDLIYLASPYNHAEPEVRERRFQLVVEATAALMRDGHVVYSPIAHNHHVAVYPGFPRTWDYWSRFDEVILSRCDRLWILMIDGWRESVGIKGEIEIAGRLGLPVQYITIANNQCLITAEA